MTVPLFLSPDELRELTGYQYASRQKTWLSQRGWTFETDHSGRPKVLRTHLENRLGGAGHRVSPKEPNFAALKGFRG